MVRFLTERQLEVLRYVERVLATRGVAPTLREIAQTFSFASTASAQKHLLALERKGARHELEQGGAGLHAMIGTGG